MFTLEQIKAAHSKVKSGADFPAYIRDLKQLGVSHYETYVHDGHTLYSGSSEITAPSRYSRQPISDVCNTEQFKTDLKAHQQGKTDFPTFCGMCARLGIEKWIVNINNMTCTYFDTRGKEVLAEKIPG
ncbi:MAG: DUF1398 family protein [Bacteroidia bacterium]|jgi:uncharacterized protein YbcV (DUF1398 family)